MHLSKKLAWLVLAAGLMVLPACSALMPSPTPTQDAGKVLTEVSIKVNAELTQAAAETPSPTPSPIPSVTPIPPTPTITLTPTISGTPPTATAGPSPTRVTGADKAELVKQSIPDKSKFNPGAPFSVTWTFKNVGKTTWSADYAARYWSDDRMGSPDTNKFGQEVKPGDSIDLTINFKAPVNIGTYKSSWWLQSADGVNFFPFFIEIDVVSALPTPPTSTPTTVSATATPTTTPATAAPSQTVTPTK
jgi:hypothetical protein